MQGYVFPFTLHVGIAKTIGGIFIYFQLCKYNNEVSWVKVSFCFEVERNVFY